MNLDYFQILKNSFEFTLKHKILWLFGLLIAFFGNNGFNFSNNYSQKDFNNSIGKMAPGTEKMLVDWLSKPESILVIFIMLFLVLLLAALAWYVKTIAATALMYAVQKENSVTTFSFKTLWKEAHNPLKDLVMLDLIWFILVFGVALVLGAILIAFAVLTSGLIQRELLFCLMCLLIPFIVIAAVLVSILYKYEQRLIVLYTMKPMEAFMYSFKSLRETFTKFFIGLLVSIIPGLIMAFVYIVLGLILIVPLAIGIFALTQYTSLSLLAVVIGAFLFIVVLAVVSLIQAPFNVLLETYWTKLIMAIHEETLH